MSMLQAMPYLKSPKTPKKTLRRFLMDSIWSVLMYNIILYKFPMSKKIQVSFSDKQIELLDLFKGEMGDNYSDIVRSIVISWLSEKDFISSIAKNRIENNKDIK